MDEACAAMLLRICYNRLRQSWVPGGYPPHRPVGRDGTAGVGALPGSKRSQERQRLLEVGACCQRQRVEAQGAAGGVLDGHAPTEAVGVEPGACALPVPAP